MEVLYQPGDVIQDRYSILGVLGEGGTAITYEAIDLEVEQLSVAVKVLSLKRAQDWKILELFEREVIPFLFEVALNILDLNLSFILIYDGRDAKTQRS